MMKNYKWILLLLNLGLLLSYLNYSVFKKEETLKNGTLLLFELAPVDPRSLMQGDYMILQYKITENWISENTPRQGYCIVKKDKNKIAQKIRLQSEQIPLNDDEYAIKYNASNPSNISIGAESYFFQEGEAEKFSNAKYGALMVDKKGNSLLIGLYDTNLKKIE